MKNRVLLPIQLNDEGSYNDANLATTPARLESIDKLFDKIEPSLKKIDFDDKNGNAVTIDEHKFKKMDNFLVYGDDGIINKIPFLKQMKKELVLLEQMEVNTHKLCKVVNNEEVKKKI